ncbi:CpaF family protein [Candidatus Poriferisodalis sp.]|uniref:CpaF family protein n=1 Tax=Candidatus Poriferisodalis sp. TaxID=3101277 RepID=UPI003B01D9EC
MIDPATLAEIERSVSERARHSGLDPRAPGADRAVTGLAHEEIRRWNLGFKSGVRSHVIDDADALADRVVRDLLGYGPLEAPLADADVWEIMVNAPHEIFVKRHHGPSGQHDESFHDDEHVRRTLTRIIDDATASHRKLDPSEGLQDAQLDNGARLHIVHPDIGRGGHLIFNIRKFTGIAFSSLGDLAAIGTLTSEIADFLRSAVRARLSILFAGAPGSGKTTLLGCCAAELDPRLRVVTAEEVFELDIELPNVAGMQTRPGRAERAPVDLRRLVTGFLRMAPDVAIVGEVRDREAVPLLLTLSSGVTGYATIHAGSARQALVRLRLMCQLAPDVREMPLAAITQLVAESVDIVVHLQRGPAGVGVTEVVAVEEPGHDGTVSFETTSLYAPERHGQPPARTPYVSRRLRSRLTSAAMEMPSSSPTGLSGEAAGPATREHRSDDQSGSPT